MKYTAINESLSRSLKTLWKFRDDVCCVEQSDTKEPCWPRKGSEGCSEIDYNGQPYESYSATLKDLDIMRLSERREIICLSNFEKLFPLHKSEHEMKTRHEDKFQIRRCNSKRFANSAIPNMLKLLNKEHKDQKQQWKKLKKSVIKI